MIESTIVNNDQIESETEVSPKNNVNCSDIDQSNGNSTTIVSDTSLQVKVDGITTTRSDITVQDHDDAGILTESILTNIVTTGDKSDNNDLDRSMIANPNVPTQSVTIPKNNVEHKNVTKQQSITSKDKETRPGAYTVSNTGFTNSLTSSDVNRLIAKSRGDISALAPYQGNEQTTAATQQVTDTTTTPGAYAISCNVPSSTTSINHDTMPGALSVSNNINNNNNTSAPVSEQVRKLIAKSRGDISALAPFQVKNNTIVEQDTVSNGNDTRVSNNNISALASEQIAVSDGESLPSTSVGQDKAAGAAKLAHNTTPGAFSVSTSNTNTSAPVSDQVRRLIAKSRGDPSALTPFQIELCSIVDQNEATNDTLLTNDTTQPGAHSVRTEDNNSGPVSEQVRRLIAKTRGEESALSPFQIELSSSIDQDDEQNSHTIAEYSTPDAQCVSTTITQSTTAPVSEQVRRLIAKSRGDASALIPYQNVQETNINQMELSDDAQMIKDTKLFYAVSRTSNSEDDSPFQCKTEGDVECGEHLIHTYNDDTDGIVVANLVIEDDNNNMFLPAALEYDSDIKPKSMTSNPRFLQSIILIVSALIIGIIGLALGTTLLSKQQQNLNNENKIMKYRETIGIYENIARVISKQDLNSIRSPYKMALDWITYDDPLLLTPDHPKFMQRYLLSYFYYATSMESDWMDDCAPDSSKRDECNFSKVLNGKTVIFPARRWLSKQDECDWAGVTCDQLLQVSTINLYGLSGTFPEGIILLPYLQKLMLQSGSLRGSFPSDYMWHNTKILQHLSLQNNSFTGTIPEIVFGSRSLTYFNIRMNKFAGRISNNITKMSDLKELYLSDNALSGSLPNNFHQLHTFSLANNNISGTIHNSYGRMKYLQLFYISGNSISGSIPNDIGNLKNCKDFDVARNRLSGRIPESFWDANKLSYISLDDNFLTGTISKKIIQLKELYELFISNNQFTGTLPSRFGRSMGDLGLIQFRAHGNHFNGTVPEQLCKLREKGTLINLELDCAIPKSSSISFTEEAEITCPRDCCTLCCTADGQNCKQVN